MMSLGLVMARWAAAAHRMMVPACVVPRSVGRTMHVRGPRRGTHVVRRSAGLLSAVLRRILGRVRAWLVLREGRRSHERDGRNREG